MSWVRIPPRALPLEKGVVLGGIELFALPLSYYLTEVHMHILSLELGIIGGLITPVCSYMLSYFAIGQFFEVCFVLLYLPWLVLLPP